MIILNTCSFGMIMLECSTFVLGQLKKEKSPIGLKNKISVSVTLKSHPFINIGMKMTNQHQMLKQNLIVGLMVSKCWCIATNGWEEITTNILVVKKDVDPTLKNHLIQWLVTRTTSVTSSIITPMIGKIKTILLQAKGSKVSGRKCTSLLPNRTLDTWML